MNIKVLKSLTLLAIAFLTACSSTPTASNEAKSTAPKEPPRPPEAVSGKGAFSEMLKPARSWASDLQVLTLTSSEIPEVQAGKGKAGRWTAVFVSPSKREARTFFYSVAESGTDIHKGVTAGGAQPWSGPQPKSKPFAVGEFVTNSDQAYTVVSEKAKDWLAAHPGKKLSMYLANASNYSAPLWYVMWGDAKDGYLGHVDATTGLSVAIK